MATESATWGVCTKLVATGGAERGGLTAGSGSLSLPALEEAEEAAEEEEEEEDSSKLLADDDIVVLLSNGENNDVCNGDGYHFQDCASKCPDSAAECGRASGGGSKCEQSTTRPYRLSWPG